MSYAQKLIISKKFDNFAKRTLRVTETGPSGILKINWSDMKYWNHDIIFYSLPHYLIKDKLIDLNERTLQRECSPYLAFNDSNAFFSSEKPIKFHA